MDHVSNRFIAFVRNIPWTWWVLGAFLCVGIFVRTYHFHDWLRFNADQSRDASIVSSVIRGETSLPLLGPKAGGTDFQLGPAFYIFQIASAKIFGDRPDVMAYPDLLSSILAIPLLYCFLRLYFDRKTALLLAGIFAVSFYAVKYSRFAWNPNSLPFWTILFFFALHRLVFLAGKAEKRWAALLGIALGIGVQLHTLTLIMLPIATIVAFGYLAVYRWKGMGKLLLITSATALLLNAGQIASDFQTGGENISAFLSGVGKKQEKGTGLVRNITKDTVCFVQSGVYILTSHDSSDTCEVKSVGTERNAPFFLGGLVLFVGGISLAIRAFRRERDPSRRYFLVINLAFLLLSFLLLVPLANEISMRFFLMMVFMPFVMLGMWFEFLFEKFPRRALPVAILFSLVLVFFNTYAVWRSFAEYASYLNERSTAGMDNVLLREVEDAADFIVRHADASKTVFLDGDSKYLFKALKSIRYYTERQDIDIDQRRKHESDGSPLFLIDNTKQNEKTLKKYPTVIDWETIGRFTIFRLL